jgi:hypothetical protein
VDDTCAVVKVMGLWPPGAGRGRERRCECQLYRTLRVFHSVMAEPMAGQSYFRVQMTCQMLS